MNAHPTEHTTAIMVTDPQTAIKANRSSNEGFMFYAVGAPIRNEKFELIIFACHLSTHVMREWAKDIAKNCLAEGGSVMGLLTDGSVHMATPKVEISEAEIEKAAFDLKKQKDKFAKQAEELDPQKKKIARRKAKKKAKKGKK